jgi:hypothetical protein
MQKLFLKVSRQLNNKKSPILKGPKILIDIFQGDMQMTNKDMKI